MVIFTLYILLFFSTVFEMYLVTWKLVYLVFLDIYYVHLYICMFIDLYSCVSLTCVNGSIFEERCIRKSWSFVNRPKN